MNQTEQSDKAFAGFIRVLEVRLNCYCLRQVIMYDPKPFLQVFLSVHIWLQMQQIQYISIISQYCQYWRLWDLSLCRFFAAFCFSSVLTVSYGVCVLCFFILTLAPQFRFGFLQQIASQVAQYCKSTLRLTPSLKEVWPLVTEELKWFMYSEWPFEWQNPCCE